MSIVSDFYLLIKTAKTVGQLYEERKVLTINGCRPDAPSVLMFDKKAFFDIVPENLHGEVTKEVQEDGWVRRSIVVDGVRFTTLDDWGGKDDEPV